MKHELKKRFKKSSGKWLEKGRMIDVDDIMLKSLIASGHIADPSKPIKAKEKSEANTNTNKVKEDGGN